MVRNPVLYIIKQHERSLYILYHIFFQSSSLKGLDVDKNACCADAGVIFWASSLHWLAGGGFEQLTCTCAFEGGAQSWWAVCCTRGDVWDPWFGPPRSLLRGVKHCLRPAPAPGAFPFPLQLSATAKSDWVEGGRGVTRAVREQ